MKLALIYGEMFLRHRAPAGLAWPYRDDPRGLTGSEYGIIRTAEECAKLGHDVTLYTFTQPGEHNGVKLRPYADRVMADVDGTVSWNFDPHDFDGACIQKPLIVEQMLNSFEYIPPDKLAIPDLWTAPSERQKQFLLETEHPLSIGTYRPNPDKWITNELGCDPERFDLSIPKVPGRVIYCSSPDRGLHWLLQEWPKIKRAVPHANLRIFYRLKDWIEGFRQTPWYPPIEPNRCRALYVEEALRRLEGYDVTLCDAVSRSQLEREMCEAEVLAYPVETMRWSEGFSCSILEACAARACPVITDCDALGELYCEACYMAFQDSRDEWVEEWSDMVIKALSDQEIRDHWNSKARAFAEKHTWAAHAERLCKAIEERL